MTNSHPRPATRRRPVRGPARWLFLLALATFACGPAQEFLEQASTVQDETPAEVSPHTTSSWPESQESSIFSKEKTTANKEVPVSCAMPINLSLTFSSTANRYSAPSLIANDRFKSWGKRNSGNPFNTFSCQYR